MLVFLALFALCVSDTTYTIRDVQSVMGSTFSDAQKLVTTMNLQHIGAIYWQIYNDYDGCVFPLDVHINQNAAEVHSEHYTDIEACYASGFYDLSKDIQADKTTSVIVTTTDKDERPMKWMYAIGLTGVNNSFPVNIDDTLTQGAYDRYPIIPKTSYCVLQLKQLSGNIGDAIVWIKEYVPTAASYTSAWKTHQTFDLNPTLPDPSRWAISLDPSKKYILELTANAGGSGARVQGVFTIGSYTEPKPGPKPHKKGPSAGAVFGYIVLVLVLIACLAVMIGGAIAVAVYFVRRSEKGYMTVDG